uniref:Putative LRR receptor-like serine/threonine-protein kinase GSO1 n=1 Tax=Davidia involucrata TaxID=16924 RepID=A0A5B7CDV9_DAVIN
MAVIIMLKRVLSFVIFLLIGFSCGHVNSEDSDSDSSSTLTVLLEVKESFVEDPQTSVLKDWSEDNPSFCTWRGVSCSLQDQVQVVGLNLSNSSLAGSVSPSLGRLRNLLRLDLSSNQLSGPIPSNLSNLSS